METLVNPGRDVGARHIHGITAEDVAHAPMFGLTGYLGDLVQGRVFVAHNASFDLRFIEAEFDAVGLDVDIDQANCLCTMSLASQFLPSASRRLGICSRPPAWFIRKRTRRLETRGQPRRSSVITSPG